MLKKHNYNNKASRRYSTRSAFTKAKHKRVKRFFIIVIGVIFLLGILYILFLSPLFKIKKSSILFKNSPFLTTKAEIVFKINEQTSKKGFLSLKQNNIFFFNNKTIKNQISNDSRIDSVLVKKDIFPPCQIKLILKEAKPIANLSVLGGDNYLISSQGKIIKMNRPPLPQKNLESTPLNQVTTLRDPVASSNTDAKINLNKGQNKNIETLPWIYDKTDLNINTKKASELFKKIINFINSGIFKKNNITISKIDLTKQSGGVINITIFTQKDWNIKLNSETNFKKQTQNLELVLHNKIKNTNSLEYIDLRFNNRVFYKHQQEDKQVKAYK